MITSMLCFHMQETNSKMKFYSNSIAQAPETSPSPTSVTTIYTNRSWLNICARLQTTEYSGNTKGFMYSLILKKRDTFLSNYIYNIKLNTSNVKSITDLAVKCDRICCGYTATYIKPQKLKNSTCKVYNHSQLILKVFFTAEALKKM